MVAHLKHEIGDVDAAFRAAEVTAELTLELPSLKSMALECRGSVASFDAATGTLNVWSTSQQYYAVRDIICGIIGLAPDAVRVMARDVGGGFGLKGLLHPEDMIVRVGDVDFGGTRVVVAAGPCSVESPDQILEAAHAVREAGARLLRTQRETHAR